MNKVIIISSLVVFSLLTACTVKHEEKTCTFNNENVPCDQLTGPSTHEVHDTHHDDCANNASAFLNASQTSRVCSNANPYTDDCLQTAHSILMNEEVVSVCSNARASTESCLQEAKSRNLSGSRTVETCK